MKPFVFVDDNRELVSCKLWNQVQNPIGIVQIICNNSENDKIGTFLNNNRYIAISCNDKKKQFETLKHLKQLYQLPIFVMGDGREKFTVQEIIRNANICAGGICIAPQTRYMRPTKWQNIKSPLLIIGNKYGIWNTNMHGAENLRFIIYPDIKSGALANAEHAGVQSDILTFFNRAYMRG